MHKLRRVFPQFFCVLILCFLISEAWCSNFSERVKKEIDSHAVISFDIFDTLILRPYVRPTDLFIHLEKINNCNGFAENRVLAERATHENSGTEEITLDEIYEHISPQFQKFKEAEIKLEYAVVRANPEFQKLYNYALKKGKTVIIVSDMYLPRAVIEKMLRKCGYVSYHKLYLSSERKKTKNTSSLYREVLNEIKVAPKNVIHIGDNYFSDVEQAKRVGIDAIYYPKLTDRFLSSQDNEKFEKFYSQNGELFRSIVVSQLAYKQSQNKDLPLDKSKYWYDVGYQICGPFVFAFCDFISKQPFLRTCGNVAFIGRDGYVPWKIFQILQPEIATKYIYAPRIIGRICNLDLFRHLSIEDWNEIYKNYCSHDLGSRSIRSLEDWRFFTEQHFEYLKKLSDRKREEYKRYMSSKCDLNQNLMIIDSSTGSWTVQMLQKSIFNAEVMGCYVWISDDAVTDFKYVSFLKKIKDPIRKFVNWDFVEFMMTASESPIIDIVNNEVIHKNPSSAEKMKNEISCCIAKGAVDFARDSREILKNSDINATAVFDLINDFSDYPNSDDLKYRGGAMDSADASHSVYQHIFYDNVKVTVLSLFSFDSMHGERMTRFLNRLPFVTVKTSPKERIVYLFEILPIIRMQNYQSSAD